MEVGTLLEGHSGLSRGGGRYYSSGAVPKKSRHKQRLVDQVVIGLHALRNAADGDSTLVLASALRYSSTHGAASEHPDRYASGREP